MDTDLLLSWLQLPAGAWPPGDRALLGLPEGPTDAATAEQHALARMELLRPHQLRHPELVTEGMNRLAQALYTFLGPQPSPPASDPALEPVRPQVEPADSPAEQSYQPGIEPPGLTIEQPYSRGVEPPAPKLEEYRAGIEPRWQPMNLEPTPPNAGAPAETLPPDLPAEGGNVIVDAELVEEAASPSMPSAPSMPSQKPWRNRAPTATPVAGEGGNAEALPPGLAHVPRDRRQAYQEIVFLKRVLRVWEEMGRIVGVPGEHLDTVESVYIWLDTCGRLGKLMASPLARSEVLGGVGQMVLAVVIASHPVLVLREMLPEQRTRLAANWAAARAYWQKEYAARRRTMRETRPRKKARQWLLASLRYLQRTPEWMLVVLTLLCLSVGLLRWAIK